jgi:hypothetical protein
VKLILSNIMKNVIKTVVFAAIILVAKTSMAQINIGGQVATKIVTHAVLPNVTAAAATQKVVSQAVNATT